MTKEKNDPGSLPPDAPATPPQPSVPPASQMNVQPDPGEQPVTDETIEQTLAFAWHRFNSYDKQSDDLKDRYRRIRQMIIIFSFLTTLLAVLSAISDFLPIIQVLFIGMGLVLFAIAIRLWFYDSELKLLANWPRRANQSNNRIQSWLEAHPNARNTIRVAGIILFFTAGSVVWLLNILLISDDMPPIWPEGMAALSSIFWIALITLPLASAGLLAFASRFEAGNAWITYRVAAETIKRAIYTLRVRRSLETIRAKHLLALHDTVSTAQSLIRDSGVITPSEGTDRNLNRGPITPSYLDVPKLDNGYAPITLAQYIDWRLTPQTDWYRMRIRLHYPRARYLRALILFVGAVGALLAALKLGEFVAVTVAGVTALTAYLSLEQYEQTYGIYGHAITKLEDAASRHHILAGSQEDAKAQMVFVDEIEGIMADERALWRIGVLQGQNTTEETLNKLVSTHGSGGLDFRQLAGLLPEEKTDEEDQEGKQEENAQPSSDSRTRATPRRR